MQITRELAATNEPVDTAVVACVDPEELPKDEVVDKLPDVPVLLVPVVDTLHCEIGVKVLFWQKWDAIEFERQVFWGWHHWHTSDYMQR